MRTIHIEGTGRVARVLALRLVALGNRVSVGGRNQVAAGALAAASGAHLLESGAPIESEVLLILVQDDAIQEVAVALAPRLQPGTIALHFSGFHDCAVLAAIASLGLPVGWAHPLGSFSGQVEPDWMVDLTWCVGGDPEAVGVAEDLAQELGGKPFLLANRPGAKARYHAAASLLAGGSAVLFDLAEQLVAQDLPEPNLLREGLAQLVFSMTEQAAQKGPRGALTGPAARGDTSVLEGQLEVMDSRTRKLYTQLIAHMQEMALDSEQG